MSIWIPFFSILIIFMDDFLQSLVNIYIYIQIYNVHTYPHVVVLLQEISYTSLSMCVLHVDGQSCTNADDAMEKRTGIRTSSLYTIKWSECTSSGTRQSVLCNTGTRHQRQPKDSAQVFSTHVDT